MTVVALTVAVLSLLRCLRELRGVVDQLRGSALPLVDDLRSTVVHADAELDHRNRERLIIHDRRFLINAIRR